MIILEGKNLCERQKEINLKVIEAAKKHVPLQEITSEGNPDVEKILKIKLASEYKDINFVIEQLKSGDSLCVSKALKCEWIYDAEHAHIIHPDYLHHNIFPTMSSKMKKKTLSTISIYVRDETRAQFFYEYCINTKMTNYAYKFLIYTPESFKEKFMNDIVDQDWHWRIYEQVDWTNLIGNSFVLADIYGKLNRSLLDLRYLYSVDDQKYLDLFEKHSNEFIVGSIGAKLSRSLLKKHKERILRNPAIYLNCLKQSELIRYTSPQEAEVYLTSLMPKAVKEFWDFFFWSKYKRIIDLLEPEKKYQIVKNHFNEKYPTAEFEMSQEFYDLKCYEIMTLKERETWALNHLEKEVGVIPENESYIWYKFVNFGKAFKEMKKQIYIASNVEKRSNLLNTLVEIAKTQRELEELLNYYYKRHVNEQHSKKQHFANHILEHHKVLEFDDACWAAFDKILHSLEVYSNSSSFCCDRNFLIVSLIYHIVNEKTFPDGLYEKLHDVDIYYLDDYSKQLDDEKKDLIFNHMQQFLVGKITEFETRKYNELVKNQVKRYLQDFRQLHYDRKNRYEIESYPDVVIKFMKLDLENFGNLLEQKPKIEDEPKSWEGYYMRLLKKDSSLILEHLPLISKQCEDSKEFRINKVLTKIRTYFLNDIGKQYTEYCIKSIYDSAKLSGFICYLMNSMVFAIFQIGQENIKTDFMDKHAPTHPKIEHGKIDEHVLLIQEAICRFHCYSRPPVPLEKTALYLKGDYIHYCNDMFSMYLANLSPALRTNFIELLINAPLSIQKRGLRLAFETFESSDLKNLVSQAWNRTKNVSLRQVIYKLLIKRIQRENEKEQNELFELLKELTSTIHQDDDDEIFKDYFGGNPVPENLRGPYLQVAWKTVAALPEKNRNIERRTLVMRAFESNVRLIDAEFCMSIINNHVHKMLSEQKLRPETNPYIEKFNEMTWNLATSYILDPNENKQETDLNLVKSIVQECLNNWNESQDSETFVFQSFFKGFVENLDKDCTYYDGRKYQRIPRLFEYLLETFENKFDLSDIYSYFWDWKLGLLTRTVIDGRKQLDKGVHIDFGLQLGKLISELKSTNRYYASFFRKVLSKLSRFVEILEFLKEPLLTDSDVLVLVAYGLILSEEFEGYVFALEILPEDLSVRPLIETELQYVIKKIKEQKNQELIAFMKDKFIYSGHKVVKIVL